MQGGGGPNPKKGPKEKFRTCTPAPFRTSPHKINNYLRLPLKSLLHFVFIFEFCILLDAGETVIIGREGHKKGCRAGAPILSHSRLSGKLENICITCFDLILKCFDDYSMMIIWRKKIIVVVVARKGLTDLTLLFSQRLSFVWWFSWFLILFFFRVYARNVWWFFVPCLIHTNYWVSTSSFRLITTFVDGTFWSKYCSCRQNWDLKWFCRKIKHHHTATRCP